MFSNAFELIKENLKDSDSRYLMLIIDGNYSLYILDMLL